MKHLRAIGDLDDAALVNILETTAEMHEVQGREVKKLPTLRGRTIINLFFEDSTRTRSSFEIAGKWMSADTINITGKGSSTSKGESLRDTVLTITAMGVDALVMRHNASGSAHQVARWLDEAGINTHVINAGDGTHEHPSQALLDAYTLIRSIGDPGAIGKLTPLAGKNIAIVGDLTHSRVFRSNVALLPRLGAKVTVIAPPTLMPSGASTWAQADGFTLSDDLDAAIESGVDALMMLRVQRERMSGGYFPTAREYTIGYGLTAPRLRALEAANPAAVICHPGPMNRGLEISADAADSAASRVLDQVSAGLATRMSIFYHLMAGEERA